MNKKELESLKDAKITKATMSTTMHGLDYAWRFYLDDGRIIIFNHERREGSVFLKEVK